MILGIIVLVFITRLYVVQIMHGDEFAQRAERQYVSTSAAPFDRGSIFFTRKDGTLLSAATVTRGFVLAINPTQIQNPEDVYTQLSEYVELDRDDFLARAGKTEDPYEELAHRIPEEVGEAVRALDIPGVLLVRETWRYYPGNERAAHTLGFLAYQGDELAGRYGIERSYEEVLDRESNALYVNFFAEVFANLGSIIFDRGATQEGNVVTTLEPNVQIELEEILAGIESQWGSKSTGGIIMHPETGAIYALGARPTFDANAFEESGIEAFKNPLIENIYEFGSIIKPITMAIGIDSGAITPETTYVDAGSLRIDGAVISNFDGEARGEVPMQEVLSQSLNTGVAFIVEETGTQTFKRYMEDLHFGEETGIDLPNEARGLTGNLESPRLLEYVTASFGQGVAVSPINAARSLAAVANGGTVVTPHVAQEVRRASGLRTQLTPESKEKVFDATTTEAVTRMLVEVVDEALAGGDVAIPSMSVVAKTGTAEIPSPDGGYYDDRFLHSFFGYFPAYEPEFLIFLYTVEPQGVRYASETLTTPFMDLVKFLTNYYDVSPDRVYESIS